jgi:hypothetical protein
MKIKCSENSQYKITEIKNGTVDDIGQKLNEVILKINDLDEKMSTNETNFKSLIVGLQKDIIDLKSEKIQNQLSSSNSTNFSEVKKLIEDLNKISADRQKIVTDQIFHKINELALKADQNKVENEKKILASQKNVHQPAQNYPILLKNSDDKIVGFATMEFILGIILTLILIALIIFGAYQAKNYIKKNSQMHRLMRTSANSTVRYDAQSV